MNIIWYTFYMHKKKKLLDKDRKLLEYVKSGGREEAKKDFASLLKKAAEPLKKSKR